MLRKIFVVVLFLMISFLSYSQYVDYGQDPARLNWRRIVTDNYTIIYPSSITNKAHTFAYTLEKLYPHEIKSMTPRRTERIPVIIHPYNIESNGMVMWAPKTMNLLPSPEFDQSFQLYNIHLLTHENRHFAQMNKLNQGLARPLRYIIGEQNMLLAGFVPKWFMEGDAVAAETGLSSSGRGRESNFLMPYKAQILAGKNYTIDKWYMGSYKDFTHTFYGMGYSIVAWAREKYGTDVWNNILDDMARWKGGSPLFSTALKRHTGLKYKDLYDSAFNAILADIPIVENYDISTTLSPNSSRYASYIYPIETENGIVAYKTTIDNIPKLVLIKDNKENKLTHIARLSGKPSKAGNYIFWSEYKPGVRWEHENYSIIKRLDLETGFVSTICSNKIYFTPAPNPTGDKIAVYEYNPEKEGKIVIIDTLGNKLNEFAVIGDHEIKDLAMDSAGNIFASMTGQEGNAIMMADSKGDWYGLLEYVKTDINSLYLSGDKLLFRSGYTGVSNVFAMDTSTYQIERLTNARFGTSGATFSNDGKYLIYSNYNANGFSIVKTSIDSLKIEACKFNSPTQFRFADILSRQESFDIDTIKYPITSPYTNDKKYRKALHLFNIHSWLPFYTSMDFVSGDIDFSFNSIYPGLTLLTHNALNTLSGHISGYYDYHNGDPHANVELEYKGLFPVLNLKANVGGQSYKYELTENQITANSNGVGFNMALSSYVPINFTKGYYYHGIQPFISYNYNQDILLDIRKKYIDGGIYYYWYKMQAIADITPKFGLQIWLKTAGFPNVKMGSINYAKGTIFLPGFLRNNSIKISSSYQYQNINVGELYLSFNYIAMPRGTGYNTVLRKANSNTIDYYLPLLNPDISFGSLIYLKRIRANLFYDWTSITNTQSKTFKIDSYGFDLITDINVFRTEYAPAAVGLRICKNSFSGVNYELIMGINFK